jgi:hypothetical protein
MVDDVKYANSFALAENGDNEELFIDFILQTPNFDNIICEQDGANEPTSERIEQVGVILAKNTAINLFVQLGQLLFDDKFKVVTDDEPTDE